ncbi:hypothetical protein JJJ17_12285 [Paracoccus caeni]|uniref:Uncharacterized protein n=1 Tax=Paracoccus caeni TaxID=657651 RepID=A0A934VVA0_9RHOB|nr:hypothetical protein [Paracoccus caeni]MBK4216706.1 hypothetical protein [Paracoccus caeni]
MLSTFFDRHMNQHARILRQQVGEQGRVPNPFSTQTAAGDAKALSCHRCQCEKLYDQVMAKVLRVKNLCSSNAASCSIENFAAHRQRNRAISADYARIYMQPNGEAKRLKFAGGAALGSTHIGYAMDAALDALKGWGSWAGRGEEPDVYDESGRGIVNDNNVTNLVDWQEISARMWMDMGYPETLIGLRRLIYGNLAIYMDLGAVLHFCQMHEAEFGFFRLSKVDEFLECFDHFVAHVKDKYAKEHPVYWGNGTFGSPLNNHLRNGLRRLAMNDVEGSLTIIDHEQRHILENYMYRPRRGAVPDEDFVALGEQGGDASFSRFMNTLERVVEVVGNRNGPTTQFSGIRALLSASKLPYMLQSLPLKAATLSPIAVGPQPFLFSYSRGDFTDPNERTPWFKDVVRHFVRAENENFDWPATNDSNDFRWVWGKPALLDYGTGLDPRNPPKLRPILYDEIRSVMAAG